MTASCLYVGTVMHRRLRPLHHRFRYRVFSLLLDLDEVPALAQRMRLFGGGLAPVGFRDRDHGPGDGSPLKAWVEGQMRAAGMATGGAVRILCFPRLFGLAFNPLTVWFCHAADGALSAILYEVNNTFGQRHCYLVAVPPGDAGEVLRQQCRKDFYVSPFMPMDCTYDFRVTPPGERVGVAIAQRDADGALLHASLTARRRPITDAALATALLTHPLMSVKVLAGIHWEALHLWRRGLGLHPRPEPPQVAVTVVPAQDRRGLAA